MRWNLPNLLYGFGIGWQVGMILARLLPHIF